MTLIMKIASLTVLAVGVVVTCVETSAAAESGSSFVITFKDGRQRSFPIADVARIVFAPRPEIILKNGHRESFAAADLASMEFDPSGKTMLGRNHFVGKWEVGEGTGRNFLITLEPDGAARKSIRSGRGTWSVVDGEARIAWDDGWHDVICRVGSKHEKRAYAPGKTFSDEPSNVTDARNTNPQPI
jgi:hypothetical protein